MNNTKLARRHFIRFLAASPLFIGLGPGRLLASAESEDGLPARLAESLLAPVTTPKDALDVFDFERVAEQVLPPAHFGELATARAAKSRDHLQILSNVTTTSIEEVITARGGPVWFQLYPTSNWAVGEKMVKRAEQAGAPAVVLTVDLNSDSKRVALMRYIRLDERDCSACHDPSRDDAWLDRKPMYSDTGASNAEFPTPGMTWDYIGRLKSITDMKVVIKGVVTAEDAESAVRHGADALIVSNHGGRAEASGWGSLDSLPQVLAAVDGEIPVMIDSGFRRGTDNFKALALGASAVCIGRAYLWGLAAFGQPGVVKVLDMLRAELAMVMGQMGTPSLKDIGPQHIGRN